MGNPVEAIREAADLVAELLREIAETEAAKGRHGRISRSLMFLEELPDLAAALAAADRAAWQPIESMPRDGKTHILVAPSPVRDVPMACIKAVHDYSTTALTSDELRKLGVKWWRPQPALPPAPGDE